MRDSIEISKRRGKTVEEMYNGLWEIRSKNDKKQTIETTKENNDKNMESMTDDDWHRLNDNIRQMREHKTGIYAWVKENSDNTIEAVSYTHLDVYKRQALTCSKHRAFSPAVVHS